MLLKQGAFSIKATLLTRHGKQGLRCCRPPVVANPDLINIVRLFVELWRTPVKFTFFEHIRLLCFARSEENHSRYECQPVFEIPSEHFASIACLPPSHNPPVETAWTDPSVLTAFTSEFVNYTQHHCA